MNQRTFRSNEWTFLNVTIFRYVNCIISIVSTHSESWTYEGSVWEMTIPEPIHRKWYYKGYVYTMQLCAHSVFFVARAVLEKSLLFRKEGMPADFLNSNFFNHWGWLPNVNFISVFNRVLQIKTSRFFTWKRKFSHHVFAMSFMNKEMGNVYHSFLVCLGQEVTSHRFC